MYLAQNVYKLILVDQNRSIGTFSRQFKFFKFYLRPLVQYSGPNETIPTTYCFPFSTIYNGPPESPSKLEKNTFNLTTQSFLLHIWKLDRDHRINDDPHKISCGWSLYDYEGQGLASKSKL